MKTLSIFLLSLLLCGASMPLDAKQSSQRPNILIIVADDMGFSDVGCYGGEIRTPNLDSLAANGLRFTQFYNTARCWPTRSGIMTGYYPQQIRMDPPRGRLPQWTRLMPHYLKPLGYRCYHSGKWHVNGAPKACANGGFDHSYLASDHDRHFAPQHHTEDDKPLPPVKPGAGYYATTAIADHAIKCLKDHAKNYPDKPFLEYLAFISPHFPLHAPAEDIARYKDRYNEGWDTISKQRSRRLSELGIMDCKPAPLDPNFVPRYFKPAFLDILGNGEIKQPTAWNNLSETQKKFQASKMAVHAAMVDRMDREIGRVLDQLRAMNAIDNTVIFFLSDNGADATILVRGDGHSRDAAPGSGETFLCVGPGWAAASNTPFRRHKIWVNEGGISTPLIVHWPNGIKAKGQLRHTQGHIIDLTPTILELTGASPEKTWNGVDAPPLPGKSLVPAFASDKSIPRDFLYFHHEGNRALRVGDWKLVSAREDNDEWELFNLKKDRGETVNLAEKHPNRVKNMASRWRNIDEQYRKLAETP